MTIDNVPCALCPKNVYLDEPHAVLEVEYRPNDKPPEQFVAHRDCISDFDEPEP